jgi:hypothetical protein
MQARTGTGPPQSRISTMKQIVMLPPVDSATPHARLMYEITCLPEAQRLVLMLFHFERLSLEEMALVLDETEDEVAARLYLAYSAAGMLDGSLRAEAALQVA